MNQESEKVSPKLIEKSIEEVYPDPNVDFWDKVPIMSSKEPLLEIIEEFYSFDSGNEDITIEIGSESFKFHLLILQNYSEYFRNIPKSSSSKIQLPPEKITARAFQLILDWILSDETQIPREHFLELLIGAEYLQVGKLIRQCWTLMEDCKQFHEAEAFILYIEAKKHKLPKVQNLMLSRICRFFLTAVATRDFLELNVNEVVQFLESNNVGVNGEVDIFYTAVRWLLYDWDERNKFLEKVMDCVRFGMMDAWQIVEFQVNKNCGKLEKILTNPYLKSKLDEGLSYSSYKCSLNDEDSTYFLDFLKRLNFKMQHPRQLIDDPYWKKLYFRKFYSFENFEDYLDVVRDNALKYWKKIQIP